MYYTLQYKFKSIHRGRYYSSNEQKNSLNEQKNSPNKQKIV